MRVDAGILFSWTFGTFARCYDVPRVVGVVLVGRDSYWAARAPFAPHRASRRGCTPLPHVSIAPSAAASPSPPSPPSASGATLAILRASRVFVTGQTISSQLSGTIAAPARLRA